MMRRLAALALLWLATPAAGATGGAEDPRIATAAICDRAAVQAAAESTVPVEVLRAVTRTETGRRLAGALRPWPWTMNVEGQGFWFDGPAEAIAHAEATLAAGTRSFDMGCFQINYRWHGQHFASLAEMMDPLASARYAVRFLTTLHAETGDWTAAVGRYHSRTPRFQARYTSRYERILSALPPLPGAAPLAIPVMVAAGPGPDPEPEPLRPEVRMLRAALPTTAGAVAIRARAVEGGLLTQAAGGGGLLTRGRALFD
ncbi:MAG: lytic transglycosylase domain-containing protein [Pseudomonadota bacterium]